MVCPERETLRADRNDRWVIKHMGPPTERMVARMALPLPYGPLYNSFLFIVHSCAYYVRRAVILLPISLIEIWEADY